MISPSQVIAAEWLLVLIALALSFLLGRSKLRWLHRAEAAFARFAARRKLAILTVGLLPVVLRLALLPLMPPPTVQVEEEASYLLQADTFLHGRLSNPPLPFSRYFDTPQVLQQPRYASTRPPGEGAFLALGQFLFASPWAGVILIVSLMCMSGCWMVHGWFAPKWALLAGLLLALRIGVFTFWMNSYWGGALAATGGFLVLGAYPRLLRTYSFRYIFIMWLGIVALATTRTYEGSLLLLPVAVALALHVFGPEHRTNRKQLIQKLVIPAAALLTLFLAWSCYYNFRVTGSPLLPPYTLGRMTQNIAPPFIFGHPRPMHAYTNRQMVQRFAGWEMILFMRSQNFPGWKQGTSQKISEFWSFYIRPLFTIPLLLLPLAVRSRKLRLFVAIALTGLAGALLEVWGPSYYFAPFTPVVIIFALWGLRYLRSLRLWHSRPGYLFVTLVPLIAILVFTGLIFLQLKSLHVDEGVLQWASYENRMPQRAIVEQELQQIPGKHLVFVRYTREHDFLCEWVFNQADLQTAKIIWAREYDAHSNQQLAFYFADRHAWLVQADKPALPLRPYSPQD